VKSYSSIDHEKQEISFRDRLIYLSPDLYIHRNARVFRYPASIHEPECTPVPFRPGKMPVSRSACFVADNGRVSPGNSVEKR